MVGAGACRPPLLEVAVHSDHHSSIPLSVANFGQFKRAWLALTDGQRVRATQCQQGFVASITQRQLDVGAGAGLSGCCPRVVSATIACPAAGAADQFSISLLGIRAEGEGGEGNEGEDGRGSTQHPQPRSTILFLDGPLRNLEAMHAWVMQHSSSTDGVHIGSGVQNVAARVISRRVIAAVKTEVARAAAPLGGEMSRGSRWLSDQEDQEDQDRPPACVGLADRDP